MVTRQAPLFVAPASRRLSGGRPARLHVSSSESRVKSSLPSPVSCTGDEITYPPLAHLPRSSRRQRSLQKGNSASWPVTSFLQMGHFSLRLRLRAIGLPTRSWLPDHSRG